MLQLLYGKDSVYKKISEAMSSGISNQILIVPQHYSHEAERRLCEFCENNSFSGTSLSVAISYF